MARRLKDRRTDGAGDGRTSAAGRWVGRLARPQDEADLLRAIQLIVHPRRLAILLCLADGPATEAQLRDRLACTADGPQLGKWMLSLRTEFGLVEADTVARAHVYRLKRPRIAHLLCGLLDLLAGPRPPADVRLNAVDRAVITGLHQAGSPLRASVIAHQTHEPEVRVRESLRRLRAAGLVRSTTMPGQHHGTRIHWHLMEQP